MTTVDHKYQPGSRFGEWQVLDNPRPLGTRRNNNFVKCQCSCGHVQINQLHNLVSGRSTRCDWCMRKRQAKAAMELALKTLRTIDDLPGGKAICLGDYNETCKGWSLIVRCDCGSEHAIPRVTALKRQTLMCKPCNSKLHGNRLYGRPQRKDLPVTMREIADRLNRSKQAVSQGVARHGVGWYQKVIDEILAEKQKAGPE